MSNEWQLAHDRATAWISLGMKENILTDPEIPDSIRNRIWSFVNGDEGVDANTLPGDSEEWFSDKQSDSNWVRYCDLLNRKGWPDKVIQSIEMSTRKTMNFLFDPRKNQVSPKYGLVVGHVQSGKTANYTGPFQELQIQDTTSSLFSQVCTTTCGNKHKFGLNGS